VLGTGFDRACPEPFDCTQDRPRAIQGAVSRIPLRFIRATLLELLEERTIVGTPHDCRRRLAEVRDELGIKHMALYLHMR
jgi:alkanesulfonate monooxygenase SsuD/methylene tetrahydromethanopterin reductase-like flavin-dependent oxidoreductase (luciferase family)